MARNGRRKSGATKTSQNTSGPSGSKAPATDQRSSAPSQSPRKSPPPHSTAEPSPARRVPSQSHPRKSSLSSGIADPMMCPGSTSSRPASHPVSPAQASPISIPADAGQAAEAKKEQGNVQFKLKNYSEAVTLYSEAIESDSTNPAYLANRAAALMSLRRYAPALADMQLALSERFIGPDTPPSSKNLVRLARCYFALGQFFQARQTLSKLLQQYPNLPEGKKEEARLTKLESTLETIKRNRDRKEWTMVLIGLDTLQRELDSGGLTAKEWLAWKVEALCGKKRWEDARCLSNDLVRSHPSDPEALYCRALVMYAQGNLTATVSHCQEAMRCDPDFTKARTLLRQSRHIEAAKEAGNVAFKSSDFRTAIEKYLEARTIDPLNESITLTLDSNRAQALLKSDQTSEAVEVCEKILKIDSKHFKALRTRAKAKKAESDFDGAIADFQTAARNAPSDKERSEINAEIKSTKVLLAKSKYVDHYKILGVPRDASDDEIKKAFRKKSLIHHPDKGGNEEKFKEVNESYTILQDPQSRRRYDMIDPEHPSGSNDHCRGFGGDDDMEMPINMADLFQAGFAQRGGFRTSTTGGGAAGSRYGYSQFQSPFFSYPE